MKLVDLEKKLAEPCVRLKHTTEPRKSHLGGIPRLPEGVAWPEHHGSPLDFLARLSLAELKAAWPADWPADSMPWEGALLFFYDNENQPWGFDPADRGSWRVLRVPDLEEPAAVVNPDSETGWDHRTIEFVTGLSLPSPDRVPQEQVPEDLADDYADRTRTIAGEGPMHQIGGFPYPVQNDSMELESQLASNGLFVGNETGYNDPRAETLAAGAGDWRLLLQVDTDDDLSAMWGDCGLLFFWIRAQDAARGDFENTWVVLQCG